MRFEVIGARAFQGNTVLESVELPDGLTTIYAYAFADCHKPYPDQSVGRPYHHIRLCL